VQQLFVLISGSGAIPQAKTAKIVGTGFSGRFRGRLPTKAH